MKTKINEKQLHILKLMNTGWELGLDINMVGTYWIQEGGLGRGGKTEYPHANTIYSLYKNGYVKSITRVFPVDHYGLTDKAKELLKEA